MVAGHFGYMSLTCRTRSRPQAVVTCKPFHMMACHLAVLEYYHCSVRYGQWGAILCRNPPRNCLSRNWTRFWRKSNFRECAQAKYAGLGVSPYGRQNLWSIYFQFFWKPGWQSYIKAILALPSDTILIFLVNYECFWTNRNWTWHKVTGLHLAVRTGWRDEA